MSDNIILKFGGTSVSSAARWEKIMGVLRERLNEKTARKIIVVCSALAGVSDTLTLLLETALRQEHQAFLAELKAKHVQFSKSLNVDFEDVAGELFSNLSQLIEGIALTGETSPTLQARVMAFGELLLTAIAVEYCKAQGLNILWQDAREWLTSKPQSHVNASKNILAAHCDFAPDAVLQKKIKSGNADIYLTQGFIARDENGQTVLLGRGGSDTTAAYLSAKLQAVRCEIWTDVPGIYTTNPHLVPEARLLKHLDYDEAREIASTGAKVLHPACIEPLQQYAIPCHIYCTDHPDLQGTVITHAAPISDPQVKAISLRRNITLISMETLGMWQQVGFLANIFGCFKQHGFAVDLVSTSENNVTVSLETNALKVGSNLEALITDLNEYCQAKIISPCASVSVVGRHIRSILHQLAPAFEIFSEQQIYLMTQAANDLNLTFVVADSQAVKLLSQMHAMLFSHETEGEQLGACWESHFPAQVDPNSVWWYDKRAEIISLTQSGAKFMYHVPTLQSTAEKLLNLKAIDTIYYSIKANNQADVLNVFYEAGLGFECVSIFEVQHILNLFPNIERHRISYTPNFADLAEYQEAMPLGVYITLDNLYPLQAWGEAFSGCEVLLRLDPGHGKGHHRYVQTAGSHSKFGIDPNQLSEVIELTQRHNIKVIGLHAHTGSGIMQPNTWEDTAIFLTQFANHFNDLKIINLGGGLGVPERLGDSVLDLHAVDEAIGKVRNVYPQYQFWLESGRYCVAQAGILTVRVTQLKTKGPIHYIGIDTGMNSLIRPALYGAYHDIINLSRLDSPRSERANIVGPICESGDTFGYTRAIAPTQPGDIILITNAGAYGHVMGSHYNMRAPAQEIVLA